jgi:hypothetical protein
MCEAEYQPGFLRCSDCDVELVHVLPPAPQAEVSEEPDYVVVATAQGPFEEGQIRSFLEANGIPVQVQGEGVRRVYGININGLGAAQILVPREHAVRALDLLDRAERGELEIKSADGESNQS